MDHFNYRQNALYAEDVAITEIAAKVGTPFYCYSRATLTRHFNVFNDAFADVDHLICFAVKANSNLAVLKTLGQLGSGADCVSGGEIRRALAAGITADKIVFSGVGKTDEELRFALQAGILQFNVESPAELEHLAGIAQALDITANIAIRVNPDVDPGTHEKISTGRKEDKFGTAWDFAPALYEKAAGYSHINIQGVAIHIGSQLTKLAPFETAFKKIRGFVEMLQSKGHNITHLDLGGGLGIPYEEADIPTPTDYAAMTQNIMEGLGCKLIFEPGRLIAGNAGILVAEVIYTKETGEKEFLIIDSAMNDLLRPSLYDAYHEIVPVIQHDRGTKHYDIVGPICETGDILAKNRTLPLAQAGDLIAVRSAGAYGAVMASEYNTRPIAPEILVDGDQFAVIRKRDSYETILGRDAIPHWL